MDIVTARSLSQAKLPSCSTSLSPPPPLFHSRASLLASDAVPSQPFWIRRSSIAQLQGVSIQARKWRNLGAIHASKADIPPSSADIAERWLLQPVGDGDTRHIGFKVEMPGAFEIASNEVTVGRLPDKADLVIPVATVSALHARIQKKAGSLLVTDLDSTNGTFIDDKRLRPGVVATASPGSCVTFGDTHLAMFRVSKLEKVEAASEQQSEDKEETDRVQKSTEAAT